MYALTATLLLFPTLILSSPLTPRQSPPVDQIIITDSATSGNGCPQGSVSTTASPDKTVRLSSPLSTSHLTNTNKQVITFGFDSFQTYIGPTAAQADKSKACQIHLSLSYPAGFTYAVVDATYHGYARLDAGVTGNFLSTYFFSQAASKTVRPPFLSPSPKPKK